jgi:hypothetical protein
MNEINDFMDKYGGYWGDGHPEYTVSAWQYEVANGDTRLGYWEWAYNSAENES